MFSINFDTAAELKPLSQKEGKKYTYYVAKFGAVLDIVQNSREFKKLPENEQEENVKALLIENRDEINREIKRLLNILPQLLNTQYVRALMQLVERYNVLICKAFENNKKGEILKHYNRRAQILEEIKNSRETAGA